MKTINTSTVMARNKTTELEPVLLFQVLAALFILAILSSLIYQNYYGWSIGLIVFLFGGIKIYSWHKELMNFDWSIKITPLSMEDVIADLEKNSPRKKKSRKLQEKNCVKKTEKVRQIEKAAFSPALESI